MLLNVFFSWCIIFVSVIFWGRGITGLVRCHCTAAFLHSGCTRPIHVSWGIPSRDFSGFFSLFMWAKRQSTSWGMLGGDSKIVFFLFLSRWLASLRWSNSTSIWKAYFWTGCFNHQLDSSLSGLGVVLCRQLTWSISWGVAILPCPVLHVPSSDERLAVVAADAPRFFQVLAVLESTILESAALWMAKSSKDHQDFQCFGLRFKARRGDWACWGSNAHFPTFYLDQRY